ncbi:MAG TPA: SLC13 family permease [Vicinamibacterales bacterium]|nr:SLC13 family permease [Vicinamibacterales bacterium]
MVSYTDVASTADVAVTGGTGPAVVMLPSTYFVGICAAAAAGLLAAGQIAPLPVWLLAAEVLATILGLFAFGSFRYQIHKNALTYGMLLVIVATFSQLATSTWHVEIARQGWAAWARHHLLTFEGLDDLVHADTMLFILGLTWLVSVIAQTRLLEGITFFLLRRYKGAILPTVIAVTAVVAVASGILSGVSMIGLTIRTLVIILMLAAAPVEAVRYAVMVCTAVTTICGIWLAYGEPPNLIMRANLYPHLNDLFFLRYCLPPAIVTYAMIAWQLRSRLGKRTVNLDDLDIVDVKVADVRFLQATRHGDVMTPIELVEGHADLLGDRAEPVLQRIRAGESLGLAMVHADVEVDVRRLLLGHFVSDELADGLDRHYLYAAAGRDEEAMMAGLAVDEVIEETSKVRRRAQWFGALALVPFAVLLVTHALTNSIPLFLASFAAFAVAVLGIARIPRMRGLAFREAYHEYAEYYFLFPLFLSITLLTSAGFFDVMQTLVLHGIAVLGQSHVAFAQFAGSTFLSAILDNNIVADFASRGLHGLDTRVLDYFAMAQIAGYALGGCWTHIGCAQSVVAFAFIQRDVDEHYTPVQWIKEMTPVITMCLVLLGAMIYLEGALLRWL